MPDYKAIHGKNIQHLASDLDNAEGEGQIWFNTTTSDYKTIVKVAGAWSTGANMGTGRYGNAGSGPTSASITFGGSPPGPALCETYDGSSWTEVGDLNTGRVRIAGADQGTTTATLAFGGYVSPNNKNESEEWDGSSWTEGSNLNTARRGSLGSGTQTAGMCSTGTAAPGVTAANETYDGSSWTEVGDLNTARTDVGGGGTNTSAITVGGSVNPKQQAESWNGTSWTEVGDLNTGRTQTQGTGASNTNAMLFGGVDAVAITELWDGTSWTESGDMSTGREAAAGSGGGTSDAICAGGTPGHKNNTEEWDWSSTLGAGAWAAGGNTNVARGQTGGFVFGTQDAALLASSLGPSPPGLSLANVEEYDGSSWTEIADVNNRRYGGGSTSKGTVTSGLIYAGYSNIGGDAQPRGTAEVWNGTSWTEVNDLNTPRTQCIGAGTATAALCMAGAADPGNLGVTETYDGTSWTEVNDVNTARHALAGSGSQTDAQIAGGSSPPSVANVETWDGSSWTETTDFNTARKGLAGTQTDANDALIFGGDVTNTEAWNGTAWTEVADLSAEKYKFGGGGTAQAALAVNSGPSPQAATEEWTVGQNIKTITD